MDASKRIILAFVERLFLNEAGLDVENWSREHTEEVAVALEKLDQPGAAMALRRRWETAARFMEKAGSDFKNMVVKQPKDYWKQFLGMYEAQHESKQR